MFKEMDLSDVQLISPSRGRFHKNYFPRNNYGYSNYRYNKGRTFVDMEIAEYPEFGTYFCPYENNEIDNKRYFIKFSNYNKDYPPPFHSIKLSYELKNGNELLNAKKSSCFLIYIFFNENQEWLRLNIDLDSITAISLGENNFEENKKYSNKKKEQIIYFYLKYPPKIGHKNFNENSNNSNENDYENISIEDEEGKINLKDDNSNNFSINNNRDEEKNNSFNSSNNGEDVFNIKNNQNESNEDKIDKNHFEIKNNDVENNINNNINIQNNDIKIQNNNNIINGDKNEEKNDDLKIQTMNSQKYINKIQLFKEKENSNNISNIEQELNKSDNCLSQKIELIIKNETEKKWK